MKKNQSQVLQPVVAFACFFIFFFLFVMNRSLSDESVTKNGEKTELGLGRAQARAQRLIRRKADLSEAKVQAQSDARLKSNI